MASHVGLGRQSQRGARAFSPLLFVVLIAGAILGAAGGWIARSRSLPTVPAWDRLTETAVGLGSFRVEDQLQVSSSLSKQLSEPEFASSQQATAIVTSLSKQEAALRGHRDNLEACMNDVRRVDATSPQSRDAALRSIEKLRSADARLADALRDWTNDRMRPTEDRLLPVLGNISGSLREMATQFHDVQTPVSESQLGEARKLLILMEWIKSVDGIGVLYDRQLVDSAAKCVQTHEKLRGAERTPQSKPQWNLKDSGVGAGIEELKKIREDIQNVIQALTKLDGASGGKKTEPTVAEQLKQLTTVVSDIDKLIQ